MIEENQFAKDRIDKQLERLKAGLDAGVNLTMDMFFTFQDTKIQDKDKYDPFKNKKTGTFFLRILIIGNTITLSKEIIQFPKGKEKMGSSVEIVVVGGGLLLVVNF